MAADPLSVPCPDCTAPAGTACYHSGNPADDYGPHAGRRRAADLYAVEQGTCALCGQFMVRGSIDGAPLKAWHPYPEDAALCPRLPDPRTDWNAYAEAITAGLEAGHPGNQHFRPVDAVLAVDVAGIDATGAPVAFTTPAGPDLLHFPASIEQTQDPTTWDTLCGLNGWADDSGVTFTERPAQVTCPTCEASLPAMVTLAVCPECITGKHQNCDGRALHPVTDDITTCTCADGGHPHTL